VLLFLLVPLGLASCGDVDWETWTTSEGETVSQEVLVAYRGDEHCDWESAVFLEVGWPLGTRRENSAGKREYVRDPEGLFQRELLSTFDSSATLPADAEATGYHTNDGEAELWISPTQAGREVYVARGDSVERWPRAAKLILCA
jgi:hypothetical protein